jgi:bifunctional isochorismate lyase/aryl carrier protein
MPIPAIEPYPMPAVSRHGPDWRPDPRRAALLIHDMQGYFLSFFPAGASPTTELLANTARIRAAARSAGLPVIYSVQPGRMTRAERGLLHDVWGAGMTDEPASRDVIAELTPGPDDSIVRKYRYSAFFGTRLAALLATLGRDQLIVCGVFAHLGCVFTAADAFSHDIETFLPADAVADFSRRDHLMALDQAARCAVTMPTEQMLASLSPPPSPAGGSGTRVPPAR